jgi:hypothetical protein
MWTEVWVIHKLNLQHIYGTKHPDDWTKLFQWRDIERYGLGAMIEGNEVRPQSADVRSPELMFH